MKQLLIISGKGGTGKTSITASFAALSNKNNIVMVDCDVDAADLHLVLEPKILERKDFYGGKIAEVDINLCTGCNYCVQFCRYGAIEPDFDSSSIKINPFLCEGCTLCSYICKNGAIKLKDNLSGEWYLSETRFGPMVHAKLGIGEENSGKLVTKVLNKAREIAEKENKDLLIVDGPPGIGCPVISSFSGTDIALIVTEPTVSGLHDLKRIVELAENFQVKCLVCINKVDLNLEMANKILKYCQEKNIDLVGEIPFDKKISEAICHGLTPTEYLYTTKGKDYTTTAAILNLHQKVMSYLKDIK